MNLTKIKQKDIMNEIVPVYTTDTNIKVVNARELHKALEVKKKFADWIKVNLKNYIGAESVENTALPLKGNSEIDFIKVEIPANQNKGKSIEYILTLDTAKEVAMMSRCEKGKDIRRYFIQVEKTYNKVINTLSDDKLTNDEKINKALQASENLLINMKKELVKANRNKEYNKKVNIKLRQEIKILKEELAKAKNAPNTNNEEILEITQRLNEALEKAEYWEGAYSNLEIKLDTKENQLATLLSVRNDGKKYFNLLSQKHASAILINDPDKRKMKANVFRKAEIEKNPDVNYTNRFTSNFIDRIHPKSIPLALSTYYNALEKRLGSNFENVIGEDLIEEINRFLQESDDSLSDI